MGFPVFTIIGRVFFQGIHRKDKNIKTVFESIPIPKYAFSKNKNKNSLKPQVQRLMKTVDFLEDKNENPVFSIVNRGNICVLNKTYLFENSEITLSRAHQIFNFLNFMHFGGRC